MTVESILGLLVLPCVTIAAAAAASRRPSGTAGDVLTSARRFVYCLVPLGFGMWLAHYSFHFFTSARRGDSRRPAVRPRSGALVGRHAEVGGLLRGQGRRLAPRRTNLDARLGTARRASCGLPRCRGWGARRSRKKKHSPLARRHPGPPGQWGLSPCCEHSFLGPQSSCSCSLSGYGFSFNRCKCAAR